MIDVPWDIDQAALATSKHFALKWMRKWGWDIYQLRDAIRNAYRVDKVGKIKFEVYVQKSGSRKIITAYYDQEAKIVCISGSEGKR
jgi:hypothetical protein